MPSKIMKSGRTRWKGRIQKQGRIRQKLFSTKHEALAWEAEQRKCDWDAEPPGSVCTVAAWGKAYLTYADKFTRKTRNEKHQAFRELYAARTGQGGKALPVINPQMPVTSLTPGHVLAALQVQYRQRGGNAANKDRKNLIAAWNWGIKYLDLPERNPCAVEKFPEKRTPRYIPPEEDFWKLYSFSTGQDRVMLLTCLHLAARRSELFNLRWDDVDFGNKRVRLATRKRRDGTLEYDWLPLTSQLFIQLSEWREKRRLQEHDHLFACGNEEKGPSPGHPQYGQPYKERMQFMKGLCFKAGVRPFGFHAIRHLTASILYRLGQPVSVIQRILRHSSPTTTTLYLRTLGLEETRTALEALVMHDVPCFERKRRNVQSG